MNEPADAQRTRCATLAIIGFLCALAAIYVVGLLLVL